MSESYPDTQLETREELRAWFIDNHATSAGIWLVSWRRDDLGLRIGYEAIVQEGLCFGWIDSTAKTVDPQRNALRLTPRRPGSGWSKSNKDRLEHLIPAGLMHPAGLSVLEQAKADGPWTVLDDGEALIVPPDLEFALQTAKATEQFDALTPGRRNNCCGGSPGQIARQRGRLGSKRP